MKRDFNGFINKMEVIYIPFLEMKLTWFKPIIRIEVAFRKKL